MSILPRLPRPAPGHARGRGVACGALGAFLGLALVTACAAAEADPETAGAPAGAAPGNSLKAPGDEVVLPKVPSLGALLWDASLSLRTWGGFSDNPRMSSLNPEGSPLAGFGGEFLLLRIPVDGWEAAFFALVEQVEYSVVGFDPETVALVNARLRRTWTDGWSVGGGIEYFFLRQVFDASDIVGLPVIVRARGNTLSVRPSVAKEWGAGWKLELELEASRQWLDEPLDSFQDSGPRLTWTRSWGSQSDLGLSYRYRRRVFDDRFPLDADGLPMEGDLAFHQHEFEVPWHRGWDQAGRWRTTVRAGFLESIDSGGGFYDYHRVLLAGLVRYVRKPVELRAEARSRWYLYPVQTSRTGDDTLRRRSDLDLSARAEWTVRKGLRVFAEYEFEMSDENLVASDYRVNTAFGGVELVW